MHAKTSYDFKSLIVVTVSVAFAVFNLVSLVQLDSATDQLLIHPAQGEALLIEQDRMTVIANPDGMQWIMHTQKAAEEGLWRLPRWTDTDNHPYGRPLLWPSLHSYWLRLLGKITAISTGLPTGAAIAKAAVFSNAAYLVLFSIPISFLASRQFHLKGLVIVPVLILLSSYPKFGLRYPDHHILHVCLMLLLFQVLTIEDPAASSKPKWITAGVLLGLLFWATALSAVIVTIAIILAYPFFDSNKTHFANLRDLFWLTGTTSVIICIAYAWDFFPNYQTHLECVHPIYAICILLSTFIFNQWGLWVTSKFEIKALSFRIILYTLLGFLIIFLITLLNLQSWYTPSNLFLSRWMELISESRPLDLSKFLFPTTFNTIVLLLTAGSLLSKNKGSYGLRVAAFCSVFSGIVLAFCLSQNRMTDFLLPAFTILIALAISFNRNETVGMLLTFTLLFMGIDLFQNRKISTGELSKFGDTLKLDPYVATSYNWQLESQKILKETSGKPGSILAMPDIGIYLNYYTKYPIYGSYYWENYDGMLRNMHMVFRRKDPQTGLFPDMMEFLNAAKVNYICVSKDPQLDLRFSYTIYGSTGRIRNPENSFFGALTNTVMDSLPDGIELLMETEKTRLFKVLPLETAMEKQAQVMAN